MISFECECAGVPDGASCSLDPHPLLVDGRVVFFTQSQSHRPPLPVCCSLCPTQHRLNTGKPLNTCCCPGTNRVNQVLVVSHCEWSPAHPAVSQVGHVHHVVHHQHTGGCGAVLPHWFTVHNTDRGDVFNGCSSFETSLSLSFYFYLIIYRTTK